MHVYLVFYILVIGGIDDIQSGSESSQRLSWP